MIAPVSIHAPASPTALPPDPLRVAARELEAAFLAEMLRSAGLYRSPDGFGGGAGEDQFQSLLIRAQAGNLAAAGGIGLAESLFEALKGRAGEGRDDR